MVARVLFEALLKREGLSEGQLVWYTGMDGEPTFRCPERGVTKVEIKLTRAGRIVEYEAQIPRHDELWRLLAAMQLCHDALDNPTHKQRRSS
jgi:hypothetical protein